MCIRDRACRHLLSHKSVRTARCVCNAPAVWNSGLIVCGLGGTLDVCAPGAGASLLVAVADRGTTYDARVLRGALSDTAPLTPSASPFSGGACPPFAAFLKMQNAHRRGCAGGRRTLPY